MNYRRRLAVSPTRASLPCSLFGVGHSTTVREALSLTVVCVASVWRVKRCLPVARPVHTQLNTWRETHATANFRNNQLFSKLKFHVYIVKNIKMASICFKTLRWLIVVHIVLVSDVYIIFTEYLVTQKKN